MGKIRLWFHHCDQSFGTLYPKETDLTYFYDDEVRTSPILRQVSHYVHGIGLRQCKHCKKQVAFIVHLTTDEVETFVYDLDSQIGKEVLRLLKRAKKIT